MSLPVVAIVGAGQLGSRHLQACAALRGIAITLVDASTDALRVAQERYAAVASTDSPTVTVASDVSALPEEVALVIVATTAEVRLEVLRSITSRSFVQNWILEKVLFQHIDDYAAAEILLGAATDRTWVNCAQRLWPFFRELKAAAAGGPLEIRVSGSRWGLGCNAVHNADIAAFLWDGNLIHKADLDPDLQESKRPGFSEFTGLFETTHPSGGLVRQLSYSTGSAPFEIAAYHPDFTWIWDVGSGSIMRRGLADSWSWQHDVMQAPFQSALTTFVVQQILSGMDCGLPKYKEAARVHIGTLEALIAAAERNGHRFGRSCPIT